MIESREIDVGLNLAAHSWQLDTFFTSHECLKSEIQYPEVRTLEVSFKNSNLFRVI